MAGSLVKSRARTSVNPLASPLLLCQIGTLRHITYFELLSDSERIVALWPVWEAEEKMEISDIEEATGRQPALWFYQMEMRMEGILSEAEEQSDETKHAELRCKAAWLEETINFQRLLRNEIEAGLAKERFFEEMKEGDPTIMVTWEEVRDSHVKNGKGDAMREFLRWCTWAPCDEECAPAEASLEKAEMELSKAFKESAAKKILAKLEKAAEARRSEWHDMRLRCGRAYVQKQAANEGK